MDFSKYENLKLISQQRKSIRDFKDIPVETEKINAILQLAKLSPFASGRKNWDILVVQDPKIIKELADSVEEESLNLKTEIQEEFKDSFYQYSKNFFIFKKAPCLFIPTFRVSYTISIMLGNQNQRNIKQWERDNFLESIACVSMMILLGASSLDLGSCYMTGPLIAQEKLQKILKTRPEHEIGAIIPVGYY